jgi:hypothetical protein
MTDHPYTQLLNRNPKHRLGAQRDTAELKEHPFFKSIDWDALGKKQVTPPFKPVVDSDESTNNFDPEFTSADLRQTGIDIFDDDDMMSDESTLVNGPIATAHGDGAAAFALVPGGLAADDGSLKVGSGTNSNKSSIGAAGAAAPVSAGAKDITTTATATTARPPAMCVPAAQKNKHAGASAAHTPLSSSMQENFRGFTFQGESTLDQAMVNGEEYYLDEEDEYEEGEGEEEGEEGYRDDEDEWEDEEPVGRYRKQGNNNSGTIALEY